MKESIKLKDLTTKQKLELINLLELGCESSLVKPCEKCVLKDDPICYLITNNGLFPLYSYYLDGNDIIIEGNV